MYILVVHSVQSSDQAHGPLHTSEAQRTGPEAQAWGSGLKAPGPRPWTDPRPQALGHSLAQGLQPALHSLAQCFAQLVLSTYSCNNGQVAFDIALLCWSS